MKVKKLYDIDEGWEAVHEHAPETPPDRLDTADQLKQDKRRERARERKERLDRLSKCSDGVKRLLEKTSTSPPAVAARQARAFD